jgi:hypothetical protein
LPLMVSTIGSLGIFPYYSLSLRAKRSNPLPMCVDPMGIASSLRSSQ